MQGAGGRKDKMEKRKGNKSKKTEKETIKG